MAFQDCRTGRSPACVILIPTRFPGRQSFLSEMSEASNLHQVSYMVGRAMSSMPCENMTCHAVRLITKCNWNHTIMDSGVKQKDSGTVYYFHRFRFGNLLKCLLFFRSWCPWNDCSLVNRCLSICWLRLCVCVCVPLPVHTCCKWGKKLNASLGRTVLLSSPSTPPPPLPHLFTSVHQPVLVTL